MGLASAIQRKKEDAEMKKVPSFIWIIFGLLCVGWLVNYGHDQTEKARIQALSDSWYTNQNPKPKEAEVHNGPVESIGKTWQYSSFFDEMTSKLIHLASIESNNTVNFDFPYQGEQHATLRLRRHPRFGHDVMLIIERGQFNTRYDGTPILVRFDDGVAMKYTAAEADDHDRKILFIQGFKRFVEKMNKASVVRIEAPFYNEGNRVFEFDVSGLKNNW